MAPWWPGPGELPGLHNGSNRIGSVTLKQSLEQLDRARRAWLDGLVEQHRMQGSAHSALALARGAYLCGEYASALARFIEARDLAPHDGEIQLALLRAASASGLRELEDATLADALRRSPQSAELQLHAALREVPGDLAGARQRLQPFRQHPLCSEYAHALAALQDDRPLPDRHDDARAQARVDSLRWVTRHAANNLVFAGLPVEVLLRALDAAPSDGLTLECGVYFGRSLQLIAERSSGPVHGFDSFQGLPEAWNANEGAGAYSTAGRLPPVADNVTLHPGWFEDTLPPFFARHAGPIRLLHIDCDIYSSTRTVLAAADARLVPGSVIVFDDLLGYPGYEQHELRAFEEFAAATGLGWELVAAALLGREVAVRITSRHTSRRSGFSRDPLSQERS